MNTEMLLLGGRIIDPSQDIDAVGGVYIKNGKIDRIIRGKDALGNIENILDISGKIITPGFIDLHCHLREPGYEHKETVATGSRAAARGGFTTICCMPNTSPPLDSAESIENIKQISLKSSSLRILPIGCITVGWRGKVLTQMYELAAAGAVGFSDDGSPVSDSHLMLKALEYALPLGLPVIDHCEDPGLSGNGLMNEGVISTRLGLAGIPRAAEEVAIARDLALAAYTGARIHIAHVSTRGGVEMIRQAKERGGRVTCEAAPHHLTLTEKAVMGYETNAKVNPPLRTGDDILALLEGLNDGTVDVIATDHAPHTPNDKRQEFELAPFGISGFETALGSLLGLVHRKDIDLAVLVSKLTSGPATILGRTELGTLKPGSPADITVFDPDREWKVDVDNFASKGKNTPLSAQKLKGRVEMTIYGGNIIYKSNGE